MSGHMGKERSHDDYIKQGIEDYRDTFGDWDLYKMIDEIIILSDLKKQIERLIQSMKSDLIRNYQEKES